MGSSLISSHMGSGRADDPIESSNPRTIQEEDVNERSAWREEILDNHENRNDIVEQNENPYQGRRIGGKKKQSKNTRAKNKCPVCGKGFNAKSNCVECRSCDKSTHVRCVHEGYDEENFFCKNCKSEQSVNSEAGHSVDIPENVDTLVQEDLARQDAIGQEAFTVIVAMDFVPADNTTLTKPDIREFLQRIGLEDLQDLFEHEKIDIDTLKEMSHDDLSSVGVKAFGQRHKILKEIRSEKLPNIVNTIINKTTQNQSEEENIIKEISSDETINFGCDSCESYFETISELYEHNVSNHTNQQNSRYGGGNLYEHDNIHLPVLTLSTTEIENIAESTRVESSSHRYQCEKCEYNSSYMDELLMHNNMKHRVDSGNESRKCNYYRRHGRYH